VAAKRKMASAGVAGGWLSAISVSGGQSAAISGESSHGVAKMA